MEQTQRSTAKGKASRSLLREPGQDSRRAEAVLPGKEAAKDGAGTLVARLEGGSFIDFKRCVAEKSTEELKSQLSALLSLSANNLLQLAIIVAELERRGEDIRSLRIGILPLLRQIAAGTLVPDVVVMFAGEPRLIGKLAKLPTSEQLKIVSGERQIPVFSDAEQQKVFGEADGPKPAKRNHVGDHMPGGALNPWEARSALEALFAFAENALPRDLAENLLHVILKNHDPQAVLDRLQYDVRNHKKR